MKPSDLAGTLATPAMLVDVPRLVTAYYTGVPDVTLPAQRVAFGTSGHRGSAFDTAFNEGHVLAIAQAICDYRKHHGIDGPLYVGIDTHALSVPACASAVEVLAANAVEIMLAMDDEYTPTPVISHAILTYNRGRTGGFADGIVITPSHNPPESGGFKYNPPNGGPADNDATKWIETRANALLEGGLAGRAKGAVREGRARLDHAPARFRRCLRARPRQRARHGRDPRREAAPGGGSAGRRRRALLGSDRRALRTGSDGCQRGRRSDLPLHDPRLGRPDQDGPVLALRHAQPGRPQGPLRRCLRLRHRPRPARHRHPERGPPAAQPLPRGRDPLSLRASGALEQDGGGRQDPGQQRHDRSRGGQARAQALRGSGRLQVVRRRPARRLPRLRRRGERGRGVRPPRRHRLDHRQGRHRARAAVGGDHGADGPRPRRALPGACGRIRRSTLRPRRGAREPRAEGDARRALPGPGALRRARRRAHRGHPHPRARQRRADRRAEGRGEERLVRGPALRHRGHLQDLRRELPRRGAPAPHHRRGPDHRRRGPGGNAGGPHRERPERVHDPHPGECRSLWRTPRERSRVRVPGRARAGHALVVESRHRRVLAATRSRALGSSPTIPGSCCRPSRARASSRRAGRSGLPRGSSTTSCRPGARGRAPAWFQQTASAGPARPVSPISAWSSC